MYLYVHLPERSFWQLGIKVEENCNSMQVAFRQQSPSKGLLISFQVRDKHGVHHYLPTTSQDSALTNHFPSMSLSQQKVDTLQNGTYFQSFINDNQFRCVDHHFWLMWVMLCFYFFFTIFSSYVLNKEFHLKLLGFQAMLLEQNSIYRSHSLNNNQSMKGMTVIQF